ncbi:GEM-like protein 4 [Daucus carota subsp. sativus]|uniref:GEM-like protein 4 n=1 Tax=Daucus carota subsp. sativus TaxID=79200 RepID=UPI0007EF7952|nr:PREDICTED: GEM-like protein 4 [Daucus carota subsp. sativus]
MKNQVGKNVIPYSRSSAIPVERSLRGVLAVPVSRCHASPKFRWGRFDSVFSRMTSFGEKIDSLAEGIKEHVRIRSVTETMKGKLSLGAKILQVGGVKKVFRRNFSVKEGEKLLKVCQCYLSTSAGPLAGLLFISTDKVAFCSERSIKVSCPTGEFQRVHYRVVIPLGKIKKVNESENLKQPSRKYMRIVTRDDFEFWFMGLLNYERTIISIQNALSHAQ